MTPKDKATEVMDKYKPFVSSWTTISKPNEMPQAIHEYGQRTGRAKQCALIAVELLINGLNSIPKYATCDKFENKKIFWRNVKKELDLM